MALAFALKLSLSEANDLLSRAGYALSRCSRRDLIFEYFFTAFEHDNLTIDYVLEMLGEKMLTN